jgi:hypothetical protein
VALSIVVLDQIRIAAPLLVGLEGNPAAVPGVLDDCFHVFLDVGSNIGMHIRFLLEPDRYPDARIASNIFDSQFGKDRDNRDICVVAFEPNPMHKNRHEFLLQYYQNSSLGTVKYVYVPSAAGPNNRFVQFNHRLIPQNSRNGFDPDLGFGALRSGQGNLETVLMEVVDLSSFILENVSRRRLPKKVYGNYPEHSMAARVVMKLDIEGLEYLVYPSLIETRAICGIDLVFGEFHFKQNFFPLDFRESFNSSKVILSPNDAKTEMTRILKRIEALPYCGVKVLNVDDEAYAYGP